MAAGKTGSDSSKFRSSGRKEGASEGNSSKSNPKQQLQRRVSAYGKQLAEKESGKRHYGLRERQFRRFFKLALRQRGATGEVLLSLLERRLDNVVYMLKLAASRRQARQMIVHRHIRVNGNIVKSPSFLVGVGDVVSFGERALAREVFVKDAIEKRLNIGIKVPAWLELRKNEKAGSVLRLPERVDVSAEIEEHLIVELYSK